MDNWFAELESKLFTRIKYELCLKEGAPYPKLNCTTVSNSNTPVKFPTLYFHELQPVEEGQDLENTTINAVRETIEIQVFSNKTEKECKDIMANAISVMKSMSFDVTMFPDTQTRGDRVSFAIGRFKRLIAQGDII